MDEKKLQNSKKKETIEADENLKSAMKSIKKKARSYYGEAMNTPVLEGDPFIFECIKAFLLDYDAYFNDRDPQPCFSKPLGEQIQNRHFLEVNKNPKKKTILPLRSGRKTNL